MNLVKKSEKDITDYLKNFRVKPSVIRIKVLKRLIDHNDHPTADRIFRDLNSEIPTLSKTSIYNTLKTFLNNDIIREISIEENELKYDADLARHGHFKCIRCGNITDLDMTCEKCKTKSIEGAKVTEEQIILKGVCKKCREKGEKDG